MLPTFLGTLTPEDARALRTAGVERHFRAGDTLLHQDDDPGRVLIVERGRVRVTHVAGDGRETTLGYSGAGDPVGEVSAIDGLPRAASVHATEAVTALAFSGDAFRRVLAARPGVSLAVMRFLASKLRAADALRIDQASRNVVGRVAARLEELCGEAASGDEDAPVLELGQEELAAWVGSSREATSRALQLLRTLGVVDTGRRRIAVLDRAALRRYGR
jgi:CRP/FNR family cyclic AMP-dependent transcriptional regulator